MSRHVMAAAPAISSGEKGVVVVIALILSLALQIHKRSGTLNPDDLHEMQG